jgi:hypothetical protein
MRVFEPPEVSTAHQTAARLGVSPLWRDRHIKDHFFPRLTKFSGPLRADIEQRRAGVDPDFVPTRHYVVRP